MSEEEDGPAFPCPNYTRNDGLTKRDWFAGMALQGLLSRPEAHLDLTYAERAYEMADAMLSERRPKDGGGK